MCHYRSQVNSREFKWQWLVIKKSNILPDYSICIQIWCPWSINQSGQDTIVRRIFLFINLPELIFNYIFHRSIKTFVLFQCNPSFNILPSKLQLPLALFEILYKMGAELLPLMIYERVCFTLVVSPVARCMRLLDIFHFYLLTGTLSWWWNEMSLKRNLESA